MQKIVRSNALFRTLLIFYQYENISFDFFGLLEKVIYVVRYYLIVHD